jgi:hypothetical protein
MGPIYQNAKRNTPQDRSSTKPFIVFITNLSSLQFIIFDQSMAAAFTSQDYQLVFFGGCVSRKSEVTSSTTAILIIIQILIPIMIT